MERRGQPGGQLLEPRGDRLHRISVGEKGEVECGELTRRPAGDEVDDEWAQPLEDERRVVRPALGEPFTDGFPERDTGIDRRLGAVRGAKRPQLSTDLGEHRLLVRALQGELAGRLVPFEQLLDLRQREQLERLFAAFEHVSEAGRQHDCLHVQLLDDVRMCEEVPAGRLHWAFVEVGDDGRAILR